MTELEELADSLEELIHAIRTSHPSPRYVKRRLQELAAGIGVGPVAPQRRRIRGPMFKGDESWKRKQKVNNI